MFEKGHLTMGKQEIVEILSEQGYNVVLDGNIPILKTTDKKIKAKTVKILFQQNGYKGSFGFCIYKKL